MTGKWSSALAVLFAAASAAGQTPSSGGHDRTASGGRRGGDAVDVRAGADPDSLPVTLGPEYHDIARQLSAAYGRPYVPEVEKRVAGRVREIVTLDPLMPPGATPRGLVVVREESSKPGLQKLLETEHPGLLFLKEPGYRLILTQKEHLKAVRKNLDWVDHHVGRKGYWKVDLADVRRRVSDDLEGVDAVAYLYRSASAKPEAAAKSASESHQAPAPKLGAPASEDWRRDQLSEMWQRRILGPDMNQPSPDDERTLGLVRKAESAGAVEFLRAKGVPMAGLMVEARLPGDASKRSVLTKEGYDRWVFLRSQDAVSFFERKGVDAKWVFKLRDMDGRPLFRAGGFLTEAGDKVYRRASLGMKMFWLLPSGEVMGTRPPQQGTQPAPQPQPAPPQGQAPQAQTQSAPSAPAATGPGAAVPGAAPEPSGQR